MSGKGIGSSRTRTTNERIGQKDQDMDNAAINEHNETTKTTTPEIAMVEQTIEDTTLSSICIQQGLKIVSAGSPVSWLSRNEEHLGLSKVLDQSQDYLFTAGPAGEEDTCMHTCTHLRQ
jgi:hypothetical protein